MSTLARNIKIRRMLCGMTQDDLAEKIGQRGKTSVQRYEGGQIRPPDKVLAKIAGALKTTVYELEYTTLTTSPKKEPLYDTAQVVKQISDNIKILRLCNDLKQEDLGDIAGGYTRSAVSLWELGTHDVPLIALLNISNYFGFSIADFCYKDLSKKELVTN